MGIFDRYESPRDRALQKIQEAEEKQLEQLDLSNRYDAPDEDKLTEIPKEVFKLKHLRILKLNWNKISHLSASLGNLTSLNDLHICYNQLTSLPESLGNLTSLNTLNLLGNKLRSIPESLDNLTSLKRLYLGDNQLTGIPESLGELSNLSDLKIQNNKLRSIPESFGNLTNLKELQIQNNKLRSIPKSFDNLTNLKVLLLYNNPIEEPPLEIASKGVQAIKKYFEQLRQEGQDYIYEAKLLIVGEGGAGKTTLANKILDTNYELQERQPSTEGIDVLKWRFPCTDKEGKKRDFTVNIWDFGGQEIYHATHQFFLTKRSLYSLVADTRKEDTDFYYWLNIVELLSDNSPLLIVKNEKQNRKREINDRALRGQFTNLEKTLATNLATNRGLDEILTNIKHYIQNLPLIGQALPKTWVKVRQALEKDDRNYISLKEYLDICQDNGFTELDKKLQLSGYLHDLGVCLHFQDEEDSLLYRTVILKPTWGTDAVYKVLDNPQVRDDQGHFTRNDLRNIWHEECYSAMRGELLELMKKFQLCYEIPEEKSSFIAPQLLSENQPEYDWNETNNLILRYTYYDFMPKGIVTRFIVIMHQYIENQEYVWKSGVILREENTRAEVIENYGKREIKIRVVGNNKRNFLTIVAHEIDKINKSYQRLKYQKLIPCNCETCKNSQDPHSYSFDILLQFIADKQYDIQCLKSYKRVDILGLIDDAIDLKKLIPEDTQNSNQTITIEQYNSIAGNIQELLRKNNISSGNYNERIEGNYYEQKGDNNKMTNVTQTHSGSGDNVAGDKNVTNNYNSQDLTQAAADIQALLKQLEETNPIDTPLEQMTVGVKLAEEIKKNPTRRQKVIKVIKAMGIEALAEAVDNPVFNIAKAGIEAALESES